MPVPHEKMPVNIGFYAIFKKIKNYSYRNGTHFLNCFDTKNIFLILLPNLQNFPIFAR
jgi:hypothetical protein